jgi:hypothetical protein
MVSLFVNDFSGYEVNDHWIMIFTHVIFTVFVGILLVNFLIAVMSDTAATISKQSNTIMRLERLHYAFTTENRLSWIFGGYYNAFKEKYLTVTDNRVYLSNVRLNDKASHSRLTPTLS